MPVNPSRRIVVFRKLSRQLEKLAAKPGTENVHQFRTSARRAEAVLDELVTSPDRNIRKLRKTLGKLRQKAGRVRDLDVQINALRNLRLPEGTAHKSHLLRALANERLQREKKLAKALDPKILRDLRKRLKRASSEVRIAPADAVARARWLVEKLNHDGGPLTEKTLHHYRIVGKRARYLAELGGDDPEAARLVQWLKSMQDLIGDWHDWLKLGERADELFGSMRNSALVAALGNVTRAKFRQAVSALAETRSELHGKKPVMVAARPAKSAPSVAKISAVA